ncbi:MAG: GDP-mannose 4,6-dehydratase [Bryobacteraceae bacterium]|nr:GDP-mannose 4,6-dehydratase [Bryobacteraceae bacterium]
MNRRKALITGITGQDGSYLAELLLARGYEVHGVVRGCSGTPAASQFANIEHIRNDLRLHGAQLESCSDIFQVVESVRPDECYHLAAQTTVKYSFEEEASTLNTNINGTHTLLAAIRRVVPDCRFCFAASAEMFGRVEEVPQRETTGFHPRSAYGVSKVAGFEMVRVGRETQKMFACSAILFNHESPRRGAGFVTRKVTAGLAEILAGRASELVLGSLDAQRDWGHARDYVEALWLMLQQDQADDFVIATGESHSVREFVELAFRLCGLEPAGYIRHDPDLLRPAEHYILRGDASKAASKLGWRPRTSFVDLVREMVESDCRKAGVGLPGERAAEAVRVHSSLE